MLLSFWYLLACLLNFLLSNKIASIRTSCQHTRKSCLFLVIIICWYPLILQLACSFACFKTFHYEMRSLVLEPLVNTQENIACSLWSFYEYTPVILTLACLFVCFRTSRHEMRLLVLETHVSIQENLACCLWSFYAYTPLILLLACSFGYFRTSRYEMRLLVLSTYKKILLAPCDHSKHIPR